MTLVSLLAGRTVDVLIGLSLPLLLYFVFAKSEGSGDTVRTPIRKSPASRVLVCILSFYVPGHGLRYVQCTRG